LARGENELIKWLQSSNKRVFLAGLLLALLAFSWCATGLAASQPTATARPDHISLSWVNSPKTTQAISWRTDESGAAGQVRFIEAAEALKKVHHYKTVTASTKVLVTPGGSVRLHSAELTGLKPGTDYLYQVGAAVNWSRVYRFKTEPAGAEPFKFLVMGDSQSLDYGVWRKSLVQATESHPDAAFFVSMGDLVDVGQDYSEWEAWYAAAAGVLEKLPMAPLTGNHECYTPGRRFSRPEYFTAQFAVPANGPVDLQGQVYSFDYGDVHFVILDSQEGEQARFVPNLLALQRDWLEADLAASSKPWKLVFIHRPLYGNKAQGINENIRRAFEPLFDRYQVDAVFTAHDHVYARSGPLFAGQPAEGRQRGTLHLATGRTGTKTYPALTAKEWNVVFHNPTDQPNYLVVTIAGGVLRLGALGIDGELIDAWLLEKELIR
jgi:acid phosphatase type 7